MTEEELVRLYPKLYHMAEAGSWPSIQKHGLLSTTALLDLFETTGSQRFDIESRWRETSKTIEHPIYGTVVIRDQKVMPEKDLEQCLDGLTARQWYELLNRKTFFWVDFQRLQWMLGAREYRNRAHCVITADTKTMLDRHSNVVTLSSQNSGSVLVNRRRGPTTFQSIGKYTAPRIAELAVEYSVPDMAKLTISVEEWKRNARLKTIWKR